MGKLLSKRLKRKILLVVIPPLGYLFIKLLYATCKKRFHLPKEGYISPSIVSFWHGEILMNPFLYKKYMKNVKISLMISEHFDGELIARTAGFFGFGFIRGSSFKGGVKALKESFGKIDKGESIAITPDGPRGPRHTVADGIVMIAQKKNIPVIVYRYKASSFWQINSWDRFIIPKPFCRLDFYASKPFYITGMSREEAKKAIKEKLSHV